MLVSNFFANSLFLSNFLTTKRRTNGTGTYINQYLIRNLESPSRIFVGNGSSFPKEENISSHEVPGSFELIYGASQLCKRGEVDAVIVIGSVIRGETSHFDYVCEGVTQGIKDLNVKYDIPVIFCVLTDDNEQQSLDRSGGKHGNKGVEAAVAAVMMTRF